MIEEINQNQTTAPEPMPEPLPEPAPAPPAYSYPAPAEKPEVVYTAAERVVAVVMLLAGILFIRLGMYHTAGLLTTLLSWGITTAELVLLKKGGHSFSVTDKLWIAVLYLFGAAYTLTASTLLKALDTVYLVMAGCLFMLYKVRPEGVLRFLPISLCKAVFAMPFMHFGAAYGAVGSGMKHNGSMKRVGHVLLGLLIAVPLTAIVGFLLCSADDNLRRMLSQLFNFDIDAAITWLPHIMIGLLLGAGMFSVVYTASHRELGLNAGTCGETVQSLRFIPNLIAYTAVTPICLLYILYAVSQMNYFLGGFTGQTNSMTYAEYARRGFFELCAVCVINIAVISCIGFFTRKTGREKPVLLKIYSVFLSLSSLFLAGTALAKMFMYIRVYGMTPLRVYTTWFMILLVIGFAALLIRQFRYAMNLGKIAVIAFTVMFGLLVFSNPDAWMIRWNADHYLSGQLEEFDADLLDELSDDALAALTQYDSAALRELSGSGEFLEARLYNREKELDFYERTGLSSWILMVWKNSVMQMQ